MFYKLFIDQDYYNKLFWILKNIELYYNHIKKSIIIFKTIIFYIEDET